MSSPNILENNSNNDNEEKNNLKKQFSRNIAKSFQSIKNSNISNKINSESSPKKIIKKKEKSDKTLLSSLFDFNFLSNNSHQTKNLSPKQKITTNQTQKDTLTKTDIEKEKLLKSKLNPILSSFKGDQTTSIQSSAKAKNKEGNRTINIKSQLIDKSKTNDKNNSLSQKKIFSKLELDPFIKRLNQYKTDKRKKLNNLRKKFTEKENSENKKIPKILKYSLFLIEKKYKKNSLYQTNQMKEKNLEKNCKDFYIRTLKESRSHSFFGKTINFAIEHFNRFYEEKIIWKKGVEEKVKEIKINQEQKEEKEISKLTFKPKINKKSINIINQKNKNSYENSLTDKRDTKSNINLNKNDKIRRENMDKYKTRLKNIINTFYDNNENYRLNKKNNLMKRSNTQINMSMRFNLFKKFNKDKKHKILEKKNIDTIDKKQKIEENKKVISNEFNSINKYTYIYKKKQKMKKKHKRKKMKDIDIYSFYKINVNSGCAWMHQSFNQINYDKRFKELIKDSIL